MQITKNQSAITSAGGLLSYIEKFASLFDQFFKNLGDDTNKAIVVSIMPDNYAKENNITFEGNKAYNADHSVIDPTNYPYRCKVKFVDKGESRENTEEGSSGYTAYDIFNFYLHDVSDDKVIKDQGVEIPVSDDKNVLRDNILNHIDTMLQKITHNDSETVGVANIVKACADVSATLKKVTSSRSTNIQLVSVTASCDPVLAKDIIDDVISDDNFIEVLPENEEVTYDIMIDDDEYEVEESDEFLDSNSSMFDDILKKLYELRLSCEYLKVTCIGPNCTNISSMCEMVKWEADSEIDFFMKAALRYTHHAPNPILLVSSIESSQFDTPNLLTIQNLVGELTNILDLYWCNFEKYDQDTITNYIQCWQASINFELSKVNGVW